MNRIIKILLVTVVIAVIGYLLLEIYKLRNKIKLLELQLQTKEQFDSTNNNLPNNINSNIVEDTNEPSSEQIETEILEYEKELQQVDALIDQIQQPSSNKNNTDIELEEENMELENIENEITKLNNTDLEEESFTENTDNEVNVEETTEQNNVLNEETVNEETVNEETVNEETFKKYLDKYNKNDLKDMCSEHSLSKKGTKKDLIQRLVENNVLDNLTLTTSDENKEQEEQEQNKVESLENNPNLEEENVGEETLEEQSENTSNQEDNEVITNNIEELKESLEQELLSSSVLYKLQQFNEKKNDYSNSEISLH